MTLPAASATTKKFSKSFTLEERLEIWSIPEPNSGCWLWLGTLGTSGGYGILSIGGKKHFAHRLSYELHNGPIPSGMGALHRCDNRICVNPDHLYAGTAADNARDASLRKRLLFGSKNRSAKLTEQQVLEIRQRSSTARVLAAKFGVNIATIKRARVGRTWGRE